MQYKLLLLFVLSVSSTSHGSRLYNYLYPPPPEKITLDLLDFVGTMANYNPEVKQAPNIKNLNDIPSFLNHLRKKSKSHFAAYHPNYVKHSGHLHQLIHHHLPPKSAISALIANAIDAHLKQPNKSINSSIYVRKTNSQLNIVDSGVGMDLATIILSLLSPYRTSSSQLGLHQGTSFFSILHFLSDESAKITVETQEKSSQAYQIIFNLKENRILVTISKKQSSQLGTQITITSPLLAHLDEEYFSSFIQKRFRFSPIPIKVQGRLINDHRYQSGCNSPFETGTSRVVFLRGSEVVESFYHQTAHACRYLIIPISTSLDIGTTTTWSVHQPQVKIFLHTLFLNLARTKDTYALNSLAPLTSALDAPVLANLRQILEQNYTHILPAKAESVAIKEIFGKKPIFLNEEILPMRLPKPHWTEKSKDFYWAKLTNRPFTSFEASNGRICYFLDTSMGSQGVAFFNLACDMLRLWENSVHFNFTPLLDYSHKFLAAMSTPAHNNSASDASDLFTKKIDDNTKDRNSHYTEESDNKNEYSQSLFTNDGFFKSFNNPISLESEKIAKAAIAQVEKAQDNINRYTLFPLLMTYRKDIIAFYRYFNLDMKTFFILLTEADRLAQTLHDRYEMESLRTQLQERAWLMLESNLMMLSNQGEGLILSIENAYPLFMKMNQFRKNLHGRSQITKSIQSLQDLQQCLDQEGFLEDKNSTLWMPLLMDINLLNAIPVAQCVPNFKEKNRPLSQNSTVCELLYRDQMINRKIIHDCLEQNLTPGAWMVEVIKNAREAGAKVIDLSLYKDKQNQLHVAITDDGLGIAKGDLPYLYVPNLTSKTSRVLDPNFGRGFFSVIAAFSSVIFLNYPGANRYNLLSFERTNNDILFYEEEKKISSADPVRGVRILGKLSSHSNAQAEAMPLLLSWIQAGNNMPGIQITFNNNKLPDAKLTQLSNENRIESRTIIISNKMIQLEVYKNRYEGIYYNGQPFQHSLASYFSHLNIEKLYLESGTKLVVNIIGQLPQSVDRRQFMDAQALDPLIRGVVALAILRQKAQTLTKGLAPTGIISYDFYYEFNKDPLPEIKPVLALTTAINESKNFDLIEIGYIRDFYEVKNFILSLRAARISHIESYRAVRKWLLNKKIINSSGFYQTTNVELIKDMCEDHSLLNQMSSSLLGLFHKEIHKHMCDIALQEEEAQEYSALLKAREKARTNAQAALKMPATSAAGFSPVDQQKALSPVPIAKSHKPMRFVDFLPESQIPVELKGERENYLAFVSFVEKLYAEAFGISLKIMLYCEANHSDAHTSLKLHSIGFNILGSCYQNYIRDKKNKVFNPSHFAWLINAMAHELVHYNESSYHSTHDQAFIEKFRNLLEKSLMTPNLNQLAKSEFIAD